MDLNSKKINFQDRLDKLSEEQKELLKKLLLKKKQTGISVKNRIMPSSLNSTFYPLSFSQERILITEKFHPNTAKYHCPGLMRAYGEIDIKLMEKSINIVADKHQIIKAVFIEKEGNPFFKILPGTKIIPEFHDLTEKSDADLLLQEIIHKSIHQTFSFYSGPLVRLIIVKLKYNEFVFVNNFHHIIYDLMSAHILLNDLFAIYKALKKEVKLPDNNLPIQYYDYSIWQKKHFDSGGYKESLEYWKNKLTGAPQVLKLLKSGKVDPAEIVETGMNELIPFSIQEPLLDLILEFCKKTSITVFSFLFSVLNILVYRYSGQDDILIGIPVNGRDFPEVWDLIGCFINTLAIRTKIDENLSCLDFLESVKQEINEAIKHQDAPFEKVVEMVVEKREVNISPVVQILFNFIENPPSDLYLDDVYITTENLHTDEVVVEFEIEIVRHKKELKGFLNFRKDLFSTEFIHDFIRHFKILLEGIIQNPAVPLNDLNILSPKEKNLLLTCFNQTKKKHNKTACVHTLFEEIVKRYPDNTALVDGNRHYSYDELNSRANAVAELLINRGVQTEDVVAVLLGHSVEFFVCVLGVLKAGAAFLPIDTSNPQNRIRYMLNDSRVSVVLSHESFSRHMNMDDISFLNIDYDSLESIKENLPDRSLIGNSAYIIYTSGSTGEPKGVMVEHRSLINLCYWGISRFNIKHTDRSIQYYGIGFDASIFEIFPLLLSGASIFIIPENTKYNVIRLNEFINCNHITLVFLTTRIYDVFKTQENHSLRYVIIGGEKLNSFKKQNYQLVNCYGPTECTVVATSFDVCAEVENIPIGKPVDNAEIYILDKNLNIVPIGVYGEIYISGDLLARGYCNSKSLTDNCFMENPFFPGKKMYKTGDSGRWLYDGNIEFYGRTDNQVQIRGMRVELNEIQYNLLKVEGVHQAVVVLKNDSILCAYVILEHNLKIDDIRSAIAEYLPRHMIPDYIIPVEEFPLTLNGKIDAGKLPTPGPGTKTPVKNKRILPETKLEFDLAEIWKQMLGIDTDIGIDEDFFELGGNSILLVKLIYKLKQEWNIDLPFESFLTNPTIRFIGSLISKEEDLIKENKFSFSEDLSEFRNLRYKKPARDDSGKKSILLTGATGFLGIFLLHELLKNTGQDIYCLVRCKTEQEGLKRVAKHFHRWNLLIDEEDKARIHILCGDLAQDYLGLTKVEYEVLADKIQVIYHNAAYVNHILPYSKLKEVNVNGTRRIIHFALTNGIQRLNYISSLGVFSGIDVGPVDEEASIEEAIHYESRGYNTSKWAAERLLHLSGQMGLSVKIFRPGRIIGHSETGIGNKDDYFFRFIESCKRIKIYPEGMPQEYLFPVDFTAKAIVALSGKEECKQRIFHLCFPEPVSLTTFFDNSNSDIKKESDFTKWLNKVIEETEADSDFPIAPYIPIFTNRRMKTDESPVIISSKRTMDVLESNKILPEWTYKKIINATMNFLKN